MFALLGIGGSTYGFVLIFGLIAMQLVLRRRRGAGRGQGPFGGRRF